MLRDGHVVAVEVERPGVLLQVADDHEVLEAVEFRKTVARITPRMQDQLLQLLSRSARDAVPRG